MANKNKVWIVLWKGLIVKINGEELIFKSRYRAMKELSSYPSEDRPLMTIKEIELL